MAADRPEPLIFAAWMRRFQTLQIQDDLGDLALAFSYAKPVFLTRVLGDVNGAAVWCDDLSTTRVKTCAVVAAVSLAMTIDDLVPVLAPPIRGNGGRCI